MMETMSEENTDEVKVLEAQIEQLEAEVAALQRQQQDNQKDITIHFGGQMQDAMWVLFIFFDYKSLSNPLSLFNL